MREIRGGVFQGRFHNLLISKNNTFWAPQISRITFQVVRTVVWCRRARICKGGPTGVRMSDVPCCVGIDVAKAPLDIAVRPSGERWVVPNDADGVVTLVERWQALHPTLMVLEATGGLERIATAA